MEEFSERIYDSTGREVKLDPNGKYYDIDYDGLNNYVRVVDDKRNYILQNPIGKVYYMENVSDRGLNRVSYENNDLQDDNNSENDFDTIIAKDEDFIWVNDRDGYEINGVKGYYKYIGENKSLKVPHKIEGNELQSYYKMFESSDVEKVVSDNINIVDMRSMFFGSHANTLDLSSLDTSNVMNMGSMFRSNKAENLILSSFDTSKVTNMSHMFFGSNAEILDLSSFDTSKVTSRSYMFQASKAKMGYAKTNFDAGIFNQTGSKPGHLYFRFKSNKDYTWINDNNGYEVNGVKGYYKYVGENKTVEIPREIEGDTLTSYYKMFISSDVEKIISNNKNIVDMSYMFYSNNANSLDLYNFDTSNVINMSHMFYNNNADTLDLVSFDTSKVTNMSAMFQSNKAYTLDLSSFNTSNVTNMSHMFYGSYAGILDLSSFDTFKVTNRNYMFQASKAKEGYAKTNSDAGMFNQTGSKPRDLIFRLKSNNYYTWINDNSGYEVNGVKGYYKYIGESKVVEIPHKIEENTLTSYYKMFISSDVEKVVSDNKNIVDMSYMFYSNSASSLDLSDFDTSNVINMSHMFYNTRADVLDLTSFSTSNVTNMSSMFQSNKASDLNLSSFETSNVINMARMFYGSNAIVLDLSSFDNSKANNRNYMFQASKAIEGYARTSADAERFNRTDSKPRNLIFEVK